MTKLSKYPPINKARYNLLEVETVTKERDHVIVEWFLKGSEDGHTANVDLETYIDFLDYKGHLQTEVNDRYYTMNFAEYWADTDYNDKCTHMREYLATCASPIEYNVTTLKELAKTA